MINGSEWEIFGEFRTSQCVLKEFLEHTGLSSIYYVLKLQKCWKILWEYYGDIATS